MQKKSKWNKKNMILAAAVSLTSAFTALFFPAAESFFLNPIEFGIPAKQAVLPLCLTVLGIAAGIWLLLNLCLLIHEKLFQALICLLFGFSAAFYIQVLCCNGKMSKLDGGQQITLPTSYLTVNWLLIFAIALLPLLMLLLKQVEPVIKFTTYFKWTLIPLVSGLIFVMQLTGFGSAFLKYQMSGLKDDSEEQTYFSYEPTTSFSSEKNIIIFLVDRMDGTFIDDLMLQYPEFGDMLEGFTAYRNNTSCFTLTFPAVPDMLSGIRYNGESWLDYTNRIWADNSNVLQQIHDAGYWVNLLSDASAMYSNCNQLSQCADNLYPVMVNGKNRQLQYIYFGENGIIQTELRLALYRCTPYIMKSLFSDIFFYGFSEAAPDYHLGAVTTNADYKLHQYLEQHALDAGSSKKTFSFIHLNGAHDKDISVMSLAGGSTDPADGIINPFAEVQEVRGDFTIIQQYLKQIKELGIYDCSDIIILGDHGQQPLQKGALAEDGTLLEDVKSGFTTALMIKPANAPHEPLKIDRETEMSNAYFTASILEYAGLDHSKYGISFSEAAAGAPHEDRLLTVLLFNGYYETPEQLFKFSISGDANDYSNWTLLSGPKHGIPSEQ